MPAPRSTKQVGLRIQSFSLAVVGSPPFGSCSALPSDVTGPIQKITNSAGRSRATPIRQTSRPLSRSLRCTMRQRRSAARSGCPVSGLRSRRRLALCYVHHKHEWTGLHCLHGCCARDPDSDIYACGTKRLKYSRRSAHAVGSARSVAAGWVSARHCRTAGTTSIRHAMVSWTLSNHYRTLIARWRTHAARQDSGMP